jgi:hypothetical protein
MRRAFITAVLLIAGSISGIGCKAGSNGLDGGGDGGLDGSVLPVWVVEPGIPTQQDLFSVWGSSLKDIYAVGWNATIIHYDGMKWKMESTTSTQPLQAVHGLPPIMPMQPASTVFAVGWRGTILQRNASGMWTRLPVYSCARCTVASTTLAQDLFGLSIASMTSGIAVGDKGRVFGWDGRTWRLVHLRVPGGLTMAPIEPLGVLKSAWTSSGDHYFVSGSGGASYESSGGFMNWDALDTRISDQLRGTWGVPGDNPVYAVGLNGLVIRYDGSQWTIVRDQGAAMLPKEFLFGVDGMSGGDVTIVGWRGVAIRYLNGMWFEESTGTTEDLRGVWIDQATGTAFAVGAAGTVIRRDVPDASTDSGMDGGAVGHMDGGVTD